MKKLIYKIILITLILGGAIFFLKITWSYTTFNILHFFEFFIGKATVKIMPKNIAVGFSLYSFFCGLMINSFQSICYPNSSYYENDDE